MTEMSGHCRHCECGIDRNRRCKTCDRQLVDQCQTCHDEIAHGQIVNQNIHICGGAGGGWLDDTDAFKKNYED